MRLESTLNQLEGVIIQADERRRKHAGGEEAALDAAELSDGTRLVLSDWKLMLPDRDMVFRSAIICEKEDGYEMPMPQKAMTVIQTDDGKLIGCSGSIFDAVQELAEKYCEELDGDEPCVLVSGE